MCRLALPLVVGLACAAPVLTAAAASPPLAVNGIPLDPAAAGDDLEPLREEVAGSRIVTLAGESEEHGELFHQARLAVIRFLHERAGFDVLVLPVGIFEGAWLDHELATGAATAWLLEQRYPDGKLIYWAGRGAATELPTDSPVTRLEIAVRPPAAAGDG